MKLSTDPLDDFGWRRLDRSLLFQPSAVGKEEILRSLLRRYSFEQLTALADWNNPESVAAYRMLALDHFATFANSLRADLKDEFTVAAEKYFESELAELIQLYTRENTTPAPTNLRQAPSGFWPGGLFSTQPAAQQQQLSPESSARLQVDYRKKGFISAALAGLAQHGDLSDVEFGRRYLFQEDYNLRLEAVRIVTRFGTEGDAPDLIRVAKSTEGELKERAARAALRVSSFDSEVVKSLIETGDAVLISVVVAELIGYGNKAETAAGLEPYLFSDDQEARTRVMVFFSLSFTREEIEQLLARYMSAAVYYYDVVCCFDRALYSPVSLSSHFRKEMLRDPYSRTWTFGEYNDHDLT